jgi:hypothetical protein
MREYNIAHHMYSERSVKLFLSLIHANIIEAMATHHIYQKLWESLLYICQQQLETKSTIVNPSAILRLSISKKNNNINEIIKMNTYI